jgi:phosphohistidine phosphatase
MLGNYSKLVILVRHAEAKKTEEDPTRPLSAYGRQQAEMAASWLANLNPPVDEIRHSGKARARQTAEVFGTRLGVAPAKVRMVEGVAPHDDPAMVASEMDADDRSLMLVGHLPFLARLASRLLAGDADRVGISFATAGVVVLARVSGGWQLVAVISPEMV